MYVFVNDIFFRSNTNVCQDSNWWAKTLDIAKAMALGLPQNCLLAFQSSVQFQTVLSMAKPCSQPWLTNRWFRMSANMDSWWLERPPGRVGRIKG